jgi:outer membrane protein assembly factor BamA
MPVPRLLLLAVALSSACAHGSNTRREGGERLVAVNFEGNHELRNKTLLTGLALQRVLKRGGAPDPYLIQVDADRIRGEYMRRGYLDVDVRSRIERKADTATVIYTVEEGQRAVTRTEIIGLPADVPVAKVREQLSLEEGKPFEYEAYDLAKPRLLGVVQDAGYAHAQLDASAIADRANHTVVVELVYTAGPKATFGQVEISGANGELAEAVSDRVTFDKGQTYSAQAIVQTQRNLYGFGRFSTVQVQPDQNSNEVVGVKVSVAESARHEIKLGGGLGMDPFSYEVRGRAGYSIAGWPFPLDTVSVDLRPAYAILRDGTGNEPRIRALAKLERQDLFWTYAKGTVEAGANYLTVEAFTSYGPLARLGFETRLGSERVLLRVGWGLEQVWFPDNRINDVIKQNPMIEVDTLHLDHGQRIGAYQQALVIDLRDHPIEPTLGAYAELHVSEGTKYAGGQFEYLELVPDVRGYVPLLYGAVLAGHARYGTFFGDVPATERFFSGGTNSQRGFAERKLAPFAHGVVGDDAKMVDVPYGGSTLFESNLEARIPITTIKNMPLGAAVFLDGADVTDTRDQLDIGNLHWAVGAGLRLMTIVGPVRLDVGYRLNRTEPGNNNPVPDSHFAYHLTIGEAF